VAFEYFLLIFVVVVSLLAEGGSGKQGSVMSVGDATNDSSHRSWVKIKWDVGGTNDYRRGYEGNLDVKCVTSANGEKYYVAHLPKLGNQERLCIISHQKNIRLM